MELNFGAETTDRLSRANYAPLPRRALFPENYLPGPLPPTLSSLFLPKGPLAQFSSSFSQGPRSLTPLPIRPLLKGSPMRVKAASWMKYGLRMRISGGSLGTRVATDFQKPSDALCGHSTRVHELGVQVMMGLDEW